MKVYRYVITVDDGGAPNFEPPFTTLAVCKPEIRRCAQAGNLVIGFAGRPLSSDPHAVRWAGVIGEQMPFADYWNDLRFQNKKPGFARMPDNIYQPTGSGLQQVPNAKHSPKNIRTDLSGQFVLVFDRVWYFGPSNPGLPAKFGLRIVGGRRHHRVTEISSRCWSELERWLDEHLPTIKPTVGPSKRGRKTKC